MPADETIKLISFSGKTDQWEFWEMKFLARASRKGYKEVLTMDETKIPVETATSTDADKKIIKWNETAYEDLVLSMDTEKKAGRVAFKIIKTCKTTKYENGNAAMA